LTASITLRSGITALSDAGRTSLVTSTWSRTRRFGGPQQDNQRKEPSD